MFKWLRHSSYRQPAVARIPLAERLDHRVVERGICEGEDFAEPPVAPAFVQGADAWMLPFDQERGTLLAAAAEQRERWGSYPVHDPAGKLSGQ